MATALEDLFATPGGPYNMGLGPIGTGGLIFKRKFRWTMSIEYCIDNEPKFVPEEFVKVGARPQIDIEEMEINFLHGKMWIPGKATWQTMTVTYYDVAGVSPDLQFGAQINSLFGWLASVYDITDPTKLYMGSRLSDYEGQGLIFLYDGCGNVIEGWLLNNVWPQSINFGELDMASSDECTIELTLRYSNVKYVSYCPGGSIDKCPCTPCDADTVGADYPIGFSGPIKLQELISPPPTIGTPIHFANDPFTTYMITGTSLVNGVTVIQLNIPLVIGIPEGEIINGL